MFDECGISTTDSVGLSRFQTVDYICAELSLRGDQLPAVCGNYNEINPRLTATNLFLSATLELFATVYTLKGVDYRLLYVMYKND